MSNQANGQSSLTDIVLAAADAKGSIGEIALMKDGYVFEGKAVVGARCIGTFACQFDNTGGADGLEVDVNLGHDGSEFTFANSAGGDAIAQAQVGSKCYVVNAFTVAKTDGGGTRSVCGVIWRLKKNGSVVVRINALA